MDDLKQKAIQIFLSTIEAIDVSRVFDRKIRVEGDIMSAGDMVIDLSRYDEVVAIGLGKASLKMGEALEQTLAGRLTRGLLVTGPQENIGLGPEIEVMLGGHPVPTQESLKAGQKLLEVAESCRSGSLIIFLISGGGSALAESLVSPDISLEDLKQLNRILIGSGASIGEINTVRKAISRIKGGGLGRRASLAGADSIAIYISDVNPGDLYSIASNPVLAEAPRRSKAQEVVASYDLAGRLPSSISAVLQSVSPAGDSVAWRPTSFLGSLLLCDNSLAVQAAGDAAGRLGFLSQSCGDLLVEGPYREVAGEMIDRLLELKRQFPERPVCLISGGEVSCPVAGDGTGGRNQEFVLYSATKLAEQCVGTGPIAVLSCGTDGIDGNSPAAGAVSDRQCIEEARRNGIDPSLYLRENDSFSFFSKVGGLVVTGPTGTNVRDIRIMLSTPDSSN